LICIDTNILIWGVQGVARAGQEGMIERTQRFLRRLAADGEQIMVPAVVVGEYLYAFPADEHEAQIQALSANFFLPPFDIRCAAIASRIQTVGPAVQGVAGVRNTLKADCQIIATAICHGADRIITANVDEFVRLACNRIPVSSVPEVWEQGDFVEEQQQPAAPQPPGEPQLAANHQVIEEQQQAVAGPQPVEEQQQPGEGDGVQPVEMHNNGGANQA
jgi:predicted nucleic acid-binding protein